MTGAEGEVNPVTQTEVIVDEEIKIDQNLNLDEVRERSEQNVPVDTLNPDGSAVVRGRSYKRVEAGAATAGAPDWRTDDRDHWWSGCKASIRTSFFREGEFDMSLDRDLAKGLAGIASRTDIPAMPGGTSAPDSFLDLKQAAEMGSREIRGIPSKRYIIPEGMLEAFRHGMMPDPS